MFVKHPLEAYPRIGIRMEWLQLTSIYITAKLEKSLYYSEITIEYGILLGLYEYKNDLFGTINSGTRVEHAQSL